MKILVIVIILICFLFASNILSQEKETDEVNFFASEEKFCEMIKNEGIKEAFTAYGFKSGFIVQTTTISFKEWIDGLEENRQFDFNPSQMVVSSSKDFGFSVGSWQESGDKKLGIWGNYLNVWQKIGSEWKIVVHSKTVMPPRISFQKSKSTDKIELPSERKPAQTATKKEAEFFSILRDYGWAKIYNELGDEDIIRIRSDAAMEKGKKGIFIKSVAERGYIQGKSRKSISSKSKDLVLFVGSAKTGGPQISAQGSFIHIWKKNSEGNYKLYLDLFISERAQERLRKKLL